MSTSVELSLYRKPGDEDADFSVKKVAIEAMEMRRKPVRNGRVQVRATLGSGRQIIGWANVGDVTILHG